MSVEVLFVRQLVYCPLDNPGASSTAVELLDGPRFSNTPKSRALPRLVCIACTNTEVAGASRPGPNCTGY